MYAFIFSMFIIVLGTVITGPYDKKVNINTKIEKPLSKSTNEIVSISETENSISSSMMDGEVTNTIITEIDKSIWKIEIPKIDLLANIAEGVSKEILDEYVGHFVDTSKGDGNIGLAAHNRGYKVNYFGNIKNLEIGDEIIYTYNGIEKVYVVNLKTIIKDTNWKILENTEDNRITLITCVENKPDLRRCIQGIEVK